MTADQSFTIGELAHAAGMTTRNVRAYRTKGLLPPPLRAGRRATYTAAHLQRLQDVQALRSTGLPLGLIMQAARRGEDLGPAGRLGSLTRTPDGDQGDGDQGDGDAGDREPGDGDAGDHDPGDGDPGGAGVATGLPAPRTGPKELQDAGLDKAVSELVWAQIAGNCAELARTVESLPAWAQLSGPARDEVVALTVRMVGDSMRRALLSDDRPAPTGR